MKRLSHYMRYDWPLHFVMILTSWLPNNIVFFRFRGWISSPFFGSCGKNLRLGRNITFYNASLIEFGRDVYVAIGCVFLANDKIQVGNEVLFGPSVVIATGGHTKDQGSFRFGLSKTAPITIGAGSWIGANTTLTRGAHIGKGCVIGCNAAVTRGKIPDDSFAAGVPAVVKKV